MKKLLIIFIILFTLAWCSQQENINWKQEKDWIYSWNKILSWDEWLMTWDENEDKVINEVIDILNDSLNDE